MWNKIFTFEKRTYEKPSKWTVYAYQKISKTQHQLVFKQLTISAKAEIPAIGGDTDVKQCKETK